MPTVDVEPDRLGLQPGFELCFFCGDPDEGDGFLHNGVPICSLCEDVHAFVRGMSIVCCDPPDDSDAVELD